jgi:hypothetical protein
MLQVCPCVRLHCGACGALLADPDDTSPHGGLATHYPTYEAALSAVRAAGWHGGARGGVRCPACGPVRLQSGVCVRVRCDHCGDALTDVTGWEVHYPTETDARTGAPALGWRPTRRGRWACPNCGPRPDCQAHGHAFTPWRLLRLDTTHDPQDTREDPHAAGVGATDAVLGRVYRYCTRCGHHHSLGTTWLITESPTRVTTPTIRALAGEGVA